MSLNESPNLEQSALRLPTLSITPSADKLREALRLATNNVQNIIELPWKAPNSPISYMIKVRAQANGQEPSWILHVGGEADDAILWNYSTADCQMISGLITAEVDRAAYAASMAAQPQSMPASAPVMSAPQIIEPPSPPPHISKNVQPAPQPAPRPNVAYDWGAGQQATQQGQDWNWSTPSISNNDANWSTSGHARLPLPAEAIVPINDPQAFSQSWGAPSPSISSPDSGLQRNTKPPGPIQPEAKPAESSIFLSGPLSQGGRNPASQTLGLPQMQPVDPLSAPLTSDAQANYRAPEIPQSLPENQSVPIGGFAHTTPFVENVELQPHVDGMTGGIDNGGATPGLATLDSVPLIDQSLQPAANENGVPGVVSGDAVRALPVVPSGRALTSTLSATLPLDVQEAITSDEQSLTAPQVDVADLPQPYALPQKFAQPAEAAVAEPDKKQINRKKGRGSKMNLPALKAADEVAEAVDQDTVALASNEMPQDTPPAIPFVYTPPEVVPGLAEISRAPVPPPAQFDPVSLFEDDPAPVANAAPVTFVETEYVPESPLVAPSAVVPAAYISPRSIDLSVIPPLPAVADFALAAPSLETPNSPPPFAVEFDLAEVPPTEPAARAARSEEQDPTVPMSIATGDDITQSRALHEPPIPVADLPQENLPSAETNALAETSAVSQSEVPPEAKVPPEAPKRPLPAPAPFNREAVDDIFKHLTNQETGFITNSAFMFFIVREFSRFQKAQTPISLIGFELALRAPDGAMYPVHLAALRECGRRFFSVMRPLDWLAHYSDDEFALLLPHTNIRESILMVKDLYTVLSQTPLLPGMEDAQVVMHCGIASIPEDCQHPGILIAAAYEAKNEAKRSNLAVQLFRDMPA